MNRHTQFAQIFTVFGTYLLDGDYVRSNDSRLSHQLRAQARRSEQTDAFRATVRL